MNISHCDINWEYALWSVRDRCFPLTVLYNFLLTSILAQAYLSFLYTKTKITHCKYERNLQIKAKNFILLPHKTQLMQRANKSPKKCTLKDCSQAAVTFPDEHCWRTQESQDDVNFHAVFSAL